ncbi:heme/steroid binding protein [Fonsecaea pedrosoi]|nr:heme/steroid binding protein [Fonsecaea pedrosoi]
MGWLAAGCWTLIAGYALYRILVRQEVVKLPAQSHLASDLVPLATEIEEPQPASDILDEEKSNPARAPRISPPHLEVSQPGDSEPPGKMADEMIPKTERMPPPPSLPKPARPTSSPRLNPPNVNTIPTPPRPGNGFIRPPPSAAASLRVPPLKPLPNASLAPTSSIMPPGKQVSRKVILEPGHSPLDWAALTANPDSHLRGKDAPGENLMRVTSAQLKRQNGRKGRDAWTVYQGKVYNITPYIPFHPGGAGEIMRGAGKDSVKLFMEVHPWVNWDAMLSECLVGILVSEGEETSANAGGLDDMD